MSNVEAVEKRHSPPTASLNGDLGFAYRTRKNGTVEVLHRGKLAATLRGAEAQDFLAQVESGEYTDGQQLMARLTGNYERGNERTASNHLRNRR